MICKSNLLAGLFLPMLLLVSTTTVYAQIPTITLEVAPQSLNLYTQGESDITLYMLNSSTKVITNLELTSFGMVGVEAIFPSDYTRTLPAQTRLAVPIHIRSSSSGLLTGDLIFQMSYQWKENENDVAIQGVTTAKLTVQLLQPLTLDKLVDIKLDTPIKTLVENQPGIINITVQNISTYTLTITDLKADGYQYIKFKLLQPTSAENVYLAPQASIIYIFEATLAGISKQGDDAGYFMTSIKWTQDGQTFSGSQVLNKFIPMGVLADQSDLLKLLGVPSYLVLPGFLLVISFAFLLKRIPPKNDLDLGLVNPELWVLSITFSILIIAIYRTVSVWIGHPSYFPEVFGLGDILTLWFISLLLGAGAWLLFWLIYNYSKRKVPTIYDTPMQILKKLERNNMGIWLKQVQVDGERHLMFPTGAGDAGKEWIIGFIEYLFTSLADEQTKSQISTLLDRVDGERNMKTAKGAHDVYNAFKKGCRSKKIRLSWSGNEWPQSVDMAKINIIDNILLVKEEGKV